MRLRATVVRDVVSGSVIRISGYPSACRGKPSGATHTRARYGWLCINKGKLNGERFCKALRSALYTQRAVQMCPKVTRERLGGSMCFRRAMVWKGDFTTWNCY